MRKHFEQCLSAKVHTFLNNSPATARNLKHDQGHPEFCLQSTTNCAHNGFKQDRAVTGAPIAISIARLSCTPMTATPHELPRPIFRGNMTGKEE